MKSPDPPEGGITQFNGTSLENPIVIYVGISSGEKVGPKTLNSKARGSCPPSEPKVSKFSRAFDKSEGGRNLF